LVFKEGLSIVHMLTKTTKNQADKLKTISYSGIFLSCFSEQSEKCIHATPEHVLVYVCSGEQIIHDNNNKITICAGECAFVRRNHRIVMYKNSEGENLYKGISLTFKRNLLLDFYKKSNKADIPKNVNIPTTNVVKLPVRPDFVSLFESLTPYFEENTKPKENLVHLKLQEGIFALLNHSEIFYPILFDFSEPWKIDILKFLNENYMYELSMEQIASYTGRSLATFKRDFKKVSSLTPQKWLIKKRLDVAYQKLKEGQKIQDVYINVGFKNLSHFSRSFRKEYGVSPNEVQN